MTDAFAPGIGALRDAGATNHGISWRALLWIALTTLAVIFLLLLRGASCGHDFEFHLLSWMDVARDWQFGVLYPHWITASNYSAGEPRLIFYPPASWLLGAALGAIGGWQSAPVLFTASALFASGLSMQRLAREWLGLQAATLAGCVYLANPYTLFVAYERTAYGELLAAAVLPLILLFALRMRPPVVPLALAYAGIWLCNAPAGVIASYMLLWLALVRAMKERTWQPGLCLGAGVALGLGLDGFYLVPAAYEQRWVEIARAAAAPGMRIGDSFLFMRTGEPYHDQVLRTASWLAVILLVTATVAFLLSRPELRKRSLAAVTLVPLVLFLLLPVSAPVWQHAPHLRFLQFPWRWLMVLSMLAALWAGAAIARLPGRVWRASMGVGLALLSIAASTSLFYQPCDQEDAIAPRRMLFLSGAGEEGTDEYTPVDTDNSAIQQNLPPVRILRQPGDESADSSKNENPDYAPEVYAHVPATVSILRWSPEDRRVRIQSAAAGYAVVRLMEYPAWRVEVNGKAEQPRLRRDDGLMVVPIGAGISNVDIAWRTTPDVLWGRVLSVLVCVLCAVLMAWSRLRARRVSLPA